MPDDAGESWYFQEGRRFPTEAEPTALCRCGASKRKPYCDGTHERTEWDPEPTSRDEALLDEAELIEGGSLTMTDNARYCVFARFCHPCGDAWTLTERSDAPEARQMAIREASMCPSGRLMAWDRTTGKPFEFRFAPSLGLIEDPAIGSSGGLWVRGRAFRYGAKTGAPTKSATARYSAAAGSRPTNRTATVRTQRSNGATASRANRSGSGCPKRSADAAEPGVRSRRTQPGHDRSGKRDSPLPHCLRQGRIRPNRPRREHPAHAARRHFPARSK